MARIESTSAREQLIKNVGGRLWKGPDVVTPEDVILYPGTNKVPLRITRRSLPPVRNIPAAERNLGKDLQLPASMRSRLAQLGAEPAKNIALQVGSQLHDLLGLQEDEEATPQDVTIDILNHGMRPIFIGADDPVLRFYTNWTGDMIEGKELVKLVEEGNINISGSYNKEWRWRYKRGTKYPTDRAINGILVAVDPDSWKYILPSDEVIRLDSKSREYRRDIDRVLYPKTNEQYVQVVYIGETLGILMIGKDALLSEDVYDFENGTLVKCNGARQIRSLAIDKGKTRHKVRLEVLYNSRTGRMPTHVGFSFYDDPIKIHM